MEDIDLGRYIYIEYSLAVLIVTELARFFIKKIPTKFAQYISVTEPKWITLMVATFLSVLDWLVIGHAEGFNFYQALISFGVAVLGYNYVWKLVKDQFKRTVIEEPKP